MEDHIPDPEGEGDDARAHRGFLRGDMLVIGYTWTDRWGRGIPKRYDFYVRRSFDGGRKFTNASGQKELPINLSNMKQQGNRGWSVMEPRLYATPGTIGSKPFTSDIQNSAVFYAAYSTTKNPHRNDGGDWNEEEEKENPDDEKAKWDGEMEEPMDLLWTMSDNFGESYYKEYNDKAEKWTYPWFAKVTGSEETGMEDTGGYAGAQIRTTPSGNKLFASYQGDRDPGSTVDSVGNPGPCGGGQGTGSSVCANTTRVDYPILTRFDVNEDGVVDWKDERDLKRNLGIDKPYSVLYDINGDGVVDGHDILVFRMGRAEYDKMAEYIDQGGIRRLRGGQ